jgi:ParB-like chromosome segregation protein Spo0J
MTEETNQADAITFFDAANEGSVKGMAKDAGAKSTDLWMVPYDEIRIAPGFNVRVHDKTYDEHIEWLASQMVERGYDKTKPMAGYVVKEDGKNFVYVTDGHSRHAAVAKARDAGAAIELIPVIVHPPGTSAEDLTVALVTSNSGKPLQPFEIATVCKRLQGYGYDNKTIAQKLGYTTAYVSNLFELLAAPKAVRDMVTSGKVSATLAVQTIKKHGKEAATVLKAGAKEAEAKGKTKITGKHVKKAAPKKKAVEEAAPSDSAPAAVATAADPWTPAAKSVIKKMADYIRTMRVGNDMQDVLDEADALIGKEDGDDSL